MSVKPKTEDKNKPKKQTLRTLEKHFHNHPLNTHTNTKLQINRNSLNKHTKTEQTKETTRPLSE